MKHIREMDYQARGADEHSSGCSSKFQRCFRVVKKRSRRCRSAGPNTWVLADQHLHPPPALYVLVPGIPVSCTPDSM